MISIENAQYFIPNHFLDLEEVAADSGNLYHLSRNELKVFNRIYGLKKIPMANGMSLSELLHIPIKKLLDSERVHPDNVRFIIYAHTSKVVVPFSNAFLRDIKKIFHFQNATILGTSVNNCASTLAALEMADVLLQEMDEDARAIILTGEIAFTQTQKLIPAVSILGDAATAMLVSGEADQHQLLALKIETHGASAAGIWMTPEESRQFEKEYTICFSKVISDAVQQADIDFSMVKYIFPHNVNLPSWHKIADYLRIPREKIYLDNIKKYSHCFGSDIVINFVDAMRHDLIQPGDYYMMATVGLGSVYAAAVFQY